MRFTLSILFILLIRGLPEVFSVQPRSGAFNSPGREPGVGQQYKAKPRQRR